MCKRFSRAAEKLNAEARLLLRRANGQEVEFVTIMWFEDLDAVRRFVGEDYARSHVPPEARAVLARFEECAAHYDVLDRRPQRV
ncbi:MAG TPA: hypothetical protein VE251_02550 [Xanthobacteraceae bacterium]|nr:hypothetical protein [Xanthobacteraceae bacterium]